MKRFRLLLVAALMTTTLSLFVFVGMASATTVTHCTPHWRVVSSATIYSGGQTTATSGGIGTVSLLRDGCGDIQAKLHPNVVVTSMYVYLTDAHNTTIGVDGSGTGPTDISTAIYSHYGCVAVSATGTIVQVAGDSPTISVAKTASNSGF